MKKEKKEAKTVTFDQRIDWVTTQVMFVLFTMVVAKLQFTGVSIMDHSTLLRYRIPSLSLPERAVVEEQLRLKRRLVRVCRWTTVRIVKRIL